MEIPILEPPDPLNYNIPNLSTVKLRVAADRRVPPSAWVRVVDKAEEIQEVAEHNGRIYRLKYNMMSGAWTVKEEF